MNSLRRSVSCRRHHRSALTLVELLVVMFVLAILLALLLPAIQGARVSARIVQVKTDINAIEAGIASFQRDFNMAPPSQLILFEEADDWATPPMGFSSTDVVRSRSIIRQLWPQFDFTMDRDINQDGDRVDRFSFAGAECLVFFLGGVPLWNDANGNSTQDSGETIPNGFAKNPLNPFAGTGNRQGPYFEFVPSRLVSSPNTGFWGYLDPLPSQTNPYIYVSSYGGQGYRPLDLGVPPRPMVDCYRQAQRTTAAVAPQAWNSTKYQIISPGLDGSYGPGGPFLPTATVRLPGYAYAIDLNGDGDTSDPGESGTVTVQQRQVEEDNITNFHSRTLKTN